MPQFFMHKASPWRARAWIGSLLLFTSACAAHYTVHPGALNMIDSAAYDTLLIAETTIDDARTAFEAGQLPAGAKDAFNALVQSYNITREVWLTYRQAISTNTPLDPYFQRLNKNLSDLTQAIRLLKQVKP